MDGDRTTCLIVQPDQWERCTHQDTALLPEGGVEITWLDERSDPCDPPAPCGPAAGLAFDRWCRAHRSRPDRGRVDSLTWETRAASEAHTCPGVFRYPLGLAVDRGQRLYVAESASGTVAVVDLWAQRLLRRVHVGGRPVDVTVECGRALVLVRRPGRLVWLDGRRRARPGPRLVHPRCHGRLEPCRIAPGPLVLWRRHKDGHAVVARVDGTVLLETDGASDLDVSADGVLVVAHGPGQPFARFVRVGEGWVETEPVQAPRYDGGAVCIAPDGRIAFTSEDGVGWTGGTVARRPSTATVVTYRLDAGDYRTRWGRVFLDACLPAGTDLRARFLTSDDDEVDDALPWTPPARGGRRAREAEDTPPLPSRLLLGRVEESTSFFRRPTGREQAWEQIPAEDRFETYEAPVLAPPGRYLWIELTLSGTERTSPRVRAMRVERPGHALLRTLPRAWSRSDVEAAFLQRFLAPAEGHLHELDQRSAERAVLVDPDVTPQEMLPWLASFAGLVLDRRWPESARRRLVGEAYTLFRWRGTRRALLRILELYLGRRPAIVEQWQLRGLGGTVLGAGPGLGSGPEVYGGLSAAGTLGRFLVGGQQTDSDSYRLAAHRFTLLVPGTLDADQREVVGSIVEAHKPAHTLCEVCELGSGMRVGSRLHVELTSFVGPAAAWAPAVVGSVRLGEDGVVGTPSVGSRLGDTSVGRVRVG
jgi:phage tail-like protein